MNQKEANDIRRKLKVLNYAQKNGNVAKTCRYFGISRETFYKWKKSYRIKGDVGLINSKPCPQNIKLRTPKHIEEKILYFRSNYHFGAQRIAWYLERYFNISISFGGVRGVLLRNGLNRLPKKVKKRSPAPEYKKYEKKIPGHHVQIDVKILKFKNNKDNKYIKRFQFTAIDDSTRIRAIKIYDKHIQNNSIDFINYVIDKFPFRIKIVRTDNGHEFQAKFHWHLLDVGIDHIYIKKGTPRLNGKVERSHKTDSEEFYQLFDYIDDVDLNKKLDEWINYYNFHRPHTSLNGKTPYEILKEKLNDSKANVN